MNKLYVNIITDFGRGATYIDKKDLDKLKETCYNNNYYYIIVKPNEGTSEKI